MRGIKTSEEQTERFVLVLRKLGFLIPAAGRTRRVTRQGLDFGYINPDVKKWGGVLGYHFGKFGQPRDAAPEGWNESRITQEFTTLYSCQSDDVTIQCGSGGGTQSNLYLIIKNPLVALEVVLSEAGI